MNPSLFPTLLAANKYRIIDYDFPVLLQDSLKIPLGPLLVLLLIVGSFVIGILFANSVRMRDYGWKIGLILCTVLVSTFILLFGDFKLGVDLKGGVILVYEVNEIETEQLRRGSRGNEWNMGQLIAVLTRRLNPTGLKEIIVRPFGPKQVEIVVPEVDQQEIANIEELIRTGGVLQFMIVASDDRDTELFEAARRQSERKGEERLSRAVIDPESRKEVTGKDGTERQIGYWAKLAHEQGEDSPYRAVETITNGFLRDSRTGEIIELAPDQKRSFASPNGQAFFDAYLKQRGTTGVDVLMVYDPEFAIRGDDLNSSLTYAGRDESFRPAIHFAMRTEGSHKMGYVTQENLQRKLAIIFDQELLSAPVIQSKITDNGQITGNFTVEEVDFIVGILKSGSMPVVMQKNPLSKNQIGAILGLDTIKKGSWSVVISLGLVLAFMALYYRFAGLVACFALVLNLLLTVGIMVLLQAPLTLPGLAGLVLTVAMSVDANVLITERMREELARGATLRMAIRNGFDKALSAIIDGNLTTFLTALVLYSIGTDQVKGFGMTLMLGNITSMFTAIFCARVIFDVAERTRWIKTLSMGSILSTPRIDWVRFFGPAIVASVLLIAVGAVATVARGKGLFDTDLAGGTSVTFILKEPALEDQVRQKLAAVFEDMTDPATNTHVDHSVYELAMEGQPKGSVYKVDSSLEEVKLLQDKVREALKLPNGQDGLKTFEMRIGSVEDAPAEPPAKEPILVDPAAKRSSPAIQPSPPATKSGPKVTEPPADASEKAEKKDAAEPAPKTPSDANEKSSDCDSELQDNAVKTEAPEAGKKSDDSTAATSKQAEPPTTTPPQPPASPAVPANSSITPPAEAPVTVPAVKSKAVLRFPGSPVSAAALKDRINASAQEVLNEKLDAFVDNPNWDRQDNSTFEDWTVTLPVDKEKAIKVVENVKQNLENEVVWQTSSKIGGQVSADTRWRAVGALAVSLLGIIAYVWFRFQNVAWGLAAVAAIAHDAVVMLTGIAASYWLVGPLGFLGVEEFKISLPVVAAFLAILGYSVNDTIVIFDRLREIRGRSPHITREMLNAAVNETLSRTIILAGITLTTVVILYAFGGPGIHAFSFAMVIGVISGCYSTLGIAAPMLLWLLNRQSALASPEVKSREKTKSVA